MDIYYHLLPRASTLTVYYLLSKYLMYMGMKMDEKKDISLIPEAFMQFTPTSEEKREIHYVDIQSSTAL